MQVFCSYRLRQPICCRNGLLRQLNMVFSRLNIISRVARMRITDCLTFGQKNICRELILLASFSEVFNVAWCTKCHKDVRITAMDEKKLSLKFAGMVPPLLLKKSRIHFVVQNDTQCSETIGKSIFRVLQFLFFEFCSQFASIFNRPKI